MRHVHLKIKKIVSFCGVPVGDKNKDMILVQYRYGTPKKIELKYPEEAMSPEGIFFKIDSSCGVIGGPDEKNKMCGKEGIKRAVALTFYSGLFRYSFFYQGNFNDHTLESEKMGLKVDRKERNEYKKMFSLNFVMKTIAKHLMSIQTYLKNLR
ncbi:hypothetical protein [Aeromonas dhakensis]|uniref:hypothetical protein n=1 Tax=Aeromonas dhakensis TaxID=196024 RepID=UPI002444A188|nr:hypothetical protein [Aeromonas dhakensis]